MTAEAKKIVFYDGDCGFCNRSVQFVLKNDTKKDIFYAPLQGVYAKDFFQKNSVGMPDMSTFYFFDGKKLYERSSAGLRVMGKLRFPWPLMLFFIVVPTFIRDGIYNTIAKRRHRIMKGFCVLPSEEERKRFIL